MKEGGGRGEGPRSGGYEIRVRGKLGPDWAEWFDGMDISQDEEGETLLSGSVPDQAALHGLLARIRDLNLILISVNPHNEGRVTK
jgi:hypothetical protein